MLEQVEALMRTAAAEAILPYFGKLAAGEAGQKTPGEWVTVADHQSEALLTAGLPAILPGSMVAGEEAATANPALLSNLANEEAVWLVDPLDGTKNFVEGHGPIAIMVALIRRGETVAACLLDPLTGIAATAEAGSGAYLGGERVTVPTGAPPVSELRGAVLTRFLSPELRARIDTRSAAFGDILPGTGCAGYEYPAIVTGAQHFALFWRTLPWDHHPGAFFAREAGATVRRLDGSPFLPDDRVGLLCAQNDEVWDLTRRALLGEEPA